MDPFILEKSPPAFHAFGAYLGELFTHSGQALSRVIYEKKVQSVKTKKIHVQGKDRKELLYHFLEEILYLYEVGGFLISKIDTLTISGMPKVGGIKKHYHLELRADVWGDDAFHYRVDSRVQFFLHKNMSIHEEQSKSGKKFVAYVLFDTEKK